MKQVYNNISTYSADLYGVNSALYELGGLLVMHDASGCNSTYNTHDEPRWWSMDSMVYVSGLDESDAVLGNDDRLINDVVDVAQKENPKFIGLTRSVLPTYLGTDMRGVARIIEKKTGIPTFGFFTNGMDSYIMGIEMAYLALARRFCLPPVYKMRHEKLAVIVIGVTPLDFSVNGNAELLNHTVEDMGYILHSNWSMGCTLEELQHAPEADVSLVVSAGGMAVAQYLWEQYQVPYVTGIPCGKAATEKLKQLILQAAETGKNQSLFSDFPETSGKHRREKVLILGEAVHSASIRYQLEAEYGFSDVKVLCPLERDAGVLRDTDFHENTEEKMENQINQADVVIADPIYRRIVHDDKILFLDDPHEAYSGRMYHSRGKIFVGANAVPFPELEKMV